MSRVILSPQHPLSAGLTADSRLVRAYRGERCDTTPVWFMRQAGRSLPEYRDLRVGTRMLDACLDPAMASRDHAAAGAPAPGRRGHLLQRHRGAAEARRRRRRDPARPRSGLRPRVRGCRGRRRADGDRPRAPRRGIRAHHRGGAAHDRRAEHDRQRLGHAPPRSSASRAPRSRSPPTSPRAAPRRTTSPPAPSCTPTRARGARSWSGPPSSRAGSCARRCSPGHPPPSSSTRGRARSRSPTTRPTWRPRRRRRSRTCTTSSTRRRMPRARP